jgi:muramidase (phage lysozyme)
LTRDDLLQALSNPNVKAFLAVIRSGESSHDDSAYTELFGGEHFTAPPWEHPQESVTVGSLTSSAAGAYQFLSKTWDDISHKYGFEDFSPANQDQAAVALIARRGALEDVKAGRLDAAIRKCAREWASLPYSPYGQPTISIAEASTTFEQFGGSLA